METASFSEVLKAFMRIHKHHPEGICYMSIQDEKGFYAGAIAKVDRDDYGVIVPGEIMYQSDFTHKNTTEAIFAINQMVNEWMEIIKTMSN